MQVSNSQQHKKLTGTHTRNYWLKLATSKDFYRLILWSHNFLSSPNFKITDFHNTSWKNYPPYDRCSWHFAKPWPSVGAVYGDCRKKGISVDDQDLDEQFGRALMKCKLPINTGRRKEFGESGGITFEPFTRCKDRWIIWGTMGIICQRRTMKCGSSDWYLIPFGPGYRLAVLSNNDSRLRSVLKDLKGRSPIWTSFYLLRTWIWETTNWNISGSGKNPSGSPKKLCIWETVWVGILLEHKGRMESCSLWFQQKKSIIYQNFLNFIYPSMIRL